jgi:diguanylate cyclase (GGDEF)-like protein
MRAINDSVGRPQEVGDVDPEIERVARSLAAETRSIQVAYKQIAYLGEAVRGELMNVVDVSDSPEALRRLGILTAGTLAATATAVLAVIDREAARNFVTGMLGKKSFRQDLENRLSSTAPVVSIVAIDLDGLKAVNESLGHPGGDDYLRAFGTHLANGVTPQGQAYHVSGDEFVLILDMNEVDATALVEQIRESSSAPFSFGVSSSSEAAEDVEELVKLADDRQLEDKRTRRAAGLAPVRDAV